MTNSIGTMSLLCGFLIIFSGVYLLNYPGNGSLKDRLADEAVTDDVGDVLTRLSLQELPRYSGETQCEDRTRLMQP